MTHLGDISKIIGSDIEPVDVITFGSPCQDLSVAGKREGMKHSGLGDEETTRSGLFMEAVRIIKEMREATNGIYPTIAVWENVPGAFSSNQGEDFRAVLEELVRIKEQDAIIPRPEKDKWRNSGCIMGDGWSLAWRVCDAQFWGVPQRRRRIALVMDFRGQSAPEILFVRQGLSRDTTESGKARKRITRDIKGSVGAAGYGETGIGYWQKGIQTLRAEGENRPSRPSNVIVEPTFCLQGSMIGRADKNGPQGDGINEDLSFTLNATDRHSVACPITPEDEVTLKIRSGCEGGGKGALIQVEKSTTLSCNNDQTLFEPVAYGVDAYNHAISGDKAVTLTAGSGSSPTHSGPMVAVACGICSYASNSMKSDNPHSGIYIAETSRTLDLNGGNPACNQGGIAICEPISVQQNADGELRTGIVANTLNTNSNASGRNAPLVAVYDARGNGDGLIAPTMTGDHQSRITDYTALCVETYQNVTGTLMANSHPGSYTGQDAYSDMLVAEHSYGELPVSGVDCHNHSEDVCYSIDRAAFNQGVNAKYDIGIDDSGVAHTLVSKGPNAVACRPRYRVRRLTPLECERLQGFPDYWTVLPQIEDMSDATYAFWQQVLLTKAGIDGKDYKPKTKEQMVRWYNRMVNPESSDSARYKALGNSIALPPWKWVMKRISAMFERDATLGSLFDGIGGFPYIWEQINGRGSAIWASEIEPFPIAVTKFRFNKA